MKIPKRVGFRLKLLKSKPNTARRCAATWARLSFTTSNSTKYQNQKKWALEGCSATYSKTLYDSTTNYLLYLGTDLDTVARLRRRGLSFFCTPITPSKLLDDLAPNLSQHYCLLFVAVLRHAYASLKVDTIPFPAHKSPSPATCLTCPWPSRRSPLSRHLPSLLHFFYIPVELCTTSTHQTVTVTNSR